MIDIRTTPRPFGTLAFLLAGPILWALHLTIVYGGQSGLCGLDVGETVNGQNMLATGTVLVGTVLILLLQAMAFGYPLPLYRALAGERMPEEQKRFFSFVMRALDGLSMLAVAYAGLAGTLLPACAQLR